MLSPIACDSEANSSANVTGCVARAQQSCRYSPDQVMLWFAPRPLSDKLVDDLQPYRRVGPCRRAHSHRYHRGYDDQHERVQVLDEDEVSASMTICYWRLLRWNPVVMQMPAPPSAQQGSHRSSRRPSWTCRRGTRTYSGKVGLRNPRRICSPERCTWLTVHAYCMRTSPIWQG